MGGSEKWSVTYTKHIKQKRKVYQDGFLELDALSHKVILYDDCENILHSRFVKKDDIIKSGETLAFDCYLVDIGDLHGDQKSLPNFNAKVTMTSKSFQSPKLGSETASVNRKPELGTERARMRNLSPSQKIIREFKKSELNKYGYSPVSSATAKSSKMEWQVLYTTQITQKAKKYHDGILQLCICSLQKQILLYDEHRRLLDSRFLKKNEVIRSGEAITFDGHLVDVGECEGDNKPLMDLNEGSNCNAQGKTKAGHETIHLQNKFPVEPQKEASSRKHFNSNPHCSLDQHKLSGLGASKKPVRAAPEILSILKKPMTQKDVAEMERQSVEESHASQSSHAYSFRAGNQVEQQSLQDICPGGRKVGDLNEESTMHKQRSETSKTEAVKVLSNEISELDKEEFLTSGLSTGSGCISKDMVDIGCTNTGETSPDPPTLEPNLLVAMELDLKVQQPITPVLQDCLTEILEKGHCTLPVSCKEDLIGAIPAAPSVLIPSFEEVEPKNITQPCADSKQIDARWGTGGHIIGTEKSNDSNSQDFCDDKLKIQEQDISQQKEDDLPSFDLGF